MTYNKEQSKKYYQEHKEKLKQYNKIYYEKNKINLRNYQKEYRLKHPDKVKETKEKWFSDKNNVEKRKKYMKEYNRNHNEKNKEKNRERQKLWLKNNRKIRNNYMKKYRKETPKKSKARDEANRKIKIPKGQLCEDCNKNLATERHHENYNKPLEVNFLCKGCHYKAHNPTQTKDNKEVKGLILNKIKEVLK